MKAEQKTKALEFFKDWSNYLLVTTVAALGFVSSQLPKSLHAVNVACNLASALCLGLSIIFGIFTLALIPLVAEQLKDDERSIYDVEVSFKVHWLWGRERRAVLKRYCWPQHVLFLLGIVLYAAGLLAIAIRAWSGEYGQPV